MKKAWLFVSLFLWILASPSTVHAMDIIQLRNLYYQAVTDRSSAESFSKIMEKMKVEADPLLLCYKGMANMVLASHSSNPYTKLCYFNKGKDMVECAVKHAPGNVEIRFMRFCIQVNAPFFLGYREDINTDKDFILGHWKNIEDKDLKAKIKNYLLMSGICTDNEKFILK